MAANNNSSVMMIAIEDSFEDDVSVDDSLSWEVVDPSDSDSDKFSYDSSIDDNDDVDVELEEGIKDDEVVSAVGSPGSDVSMEEQIDLHRLIVVRPEVVVEDDDAAAAAGETYGGDYYEGYGGGEYDEDEEEEEDEYDLDDELVPKWVNNRFERQRMRKLGKRAFPKMKNSKRLTLLHNRPGCVHGKHGLGLKHSLM